MKIKFRVASRNMGKYANLSIMYFGVDLKKIIWQNCSQFIHKQDTYVGFWLHFRFLHTIDWAATKLTNSE